MGDAGERSDESLFAAYVAGDATAHEALFRRYQDPLRRHFASMLGDPGAAEDVVIETFLRLHRHRHRFRPGTAVRPWIFTIARNLARNLARARRLQQLFGPVSPRTATRDPESDPGVRSQVAAAF